MWWGYHEGTGWWMLFSGLWMLLFWGMIVGVVIWAVKALSGRNGAGREEDPLRIAQRRYARGEISREQLAEIESTLRRKGD
ncbi:MAG: hypothetical protein HYX93_04540 [Chloroflexi bacterium]|nr:hypothetical protein [Chloroflexota bacterium]